MLVYGTGVHGIFNDLYIDCILVGRGFARRLTYWGLQGLSRLVSLAAYPRTSQACPSLTSSLDWHSRYHQRLVCSLLPSLV
jgi:hypothetical protein